MYINIIMLFSYSFCIIACFKYTEQFTVGVSFDQAEYTVVEGESLTVTGRLTKLLGELKTDFSLTLMLNFGVDDVTSE